MSDALRYVVFYDSGDLTRAAENLPAHRAWYGEFLRRGVLTSLGPFEDRGGAMSILTSREAAEEFASGDPFVLNGVVSAWHIREWWEVTPD